MSILQAREASLRKQLQQRQVPSGGDHATRELRSQLQNSLQQSDELKRRIGAMQLDMADRIEMATELIEAVTSLGMFSETDIQTFKTALTSPCKH